MSQSFVITVSGSDASGAAGLQTDNRAILAMGAFPLNVISALTLQTDRGVESIDLVAPELIRMHLLGLLNTYPVSFLKAGMLGQFGTAVVLGEVLQQYPNVKLVLDPVLEASSGRPLIDEAGRKFVSEELLEQTFLLTPNLPELERLSGIQAAKSQDLEQEAATRVMDRGSHAVLVKGGHRSGDECVDRLYVRSDIFEFRGERVSSKNTRGTGCALASLITGALATGVELTEAVEQAKDTLSRSLSLGAAENWPIPGPGFLGFS